MTLAYTYDQLDELLRGDGRGGAIGMSAIDGLIAALVAGPVFVPPDEWLPLIFAGRLPAVVAGTPEHRAVTTILTRYNEVSSTLADHPEAYRPMFMNHAGQVIVRDWVIGFMLGIGRRPGAWSSLLLTKQRKMLAPILAACDGGPDLLIDVPRAERDRLRASAHHHIADAVVALACLCRPRRAAARSTTPQRSARRAGKIKPAPL